ncbi:hypothetical protein RintRC_1613 [Richelia intracellularis]|nr:hypothetical protein RintRC_1613 [Richelia intracellularis]
MSNKVFILGGRGRIGASVGQDIPTRTEAKITITGRTLQARDDIAEYLSPRAI